METQLRNAELAQIAQVLQAQAAARYDIVVSSNRLAFHEGNLMVEGGDAVITEEGVGPVDVCLTPTGVMDEGLANKLDIPRAYLRRMRETEGTLPLLDANVNEWLARSDRQWFVRGFKGEGEECGVGRAFLSDRFNCIDNFDVLISALDGVRETGVEANIVGCDLSERRMNVKIEVPAIAELAPDLLRGYRSPFDNGVERAGGWTLEGGRAAAAREGLGYGDGPEPLIFAGFVITNSETGHGKFTITPRLIVQVCKNGLTFTKDAFGRNHLGGQMEEGVIEWSDETRQKNLELVRCQTVDAVKSFCNVEYVRTKIAEIEKAATTPINPAESVKVLERIGKANACGFSKEEQEGILGHFIQGGQMNAGGVLNAVTSYAQTVLDPDRANELEEKGIQALALVGS